MHEKADTRIEIVSYYFDKKEVACIVQQAIETFDDDVHYLYAANYLTAHNMKLYDILFKQQGRITNVILSEEQLQYLCED